KFNLTRLCPSRAPVRRWSSKAAASCCSLIRPCSCRISPRRLRIFPTPFYAKKPADTQASSRLHYSLRTSQVPRYGLSLLASGRTLIYLYFTAAPVKNGLGCRKSIPIVFSLICRRIRQHLGNLLHTPGYFFCILRCKNTWP